MLIFSWVYKHFYIYSTFYYCCKWLCTYENTLLSFITKSFQSLLSQAKHWYWGEKRKSKVDWKHPKLCFALPAVSASAPRKTTPNDRGQSFCTYNVFLRNKFLSALKFLRSCADSLFFPPFGCKQGITSITPCCCQKTSALYFYISFTANDNFSCFFQFRWAKSSQCSNSYAVTR